MSKPNNETRFDEVVAELTVIKPSDPDWDILVKEYIALCLNMSRMGVNARFINQPQ